MAASDINPSTVDPDDARKRAKAEDPPMAPEPTLVVAGADPTPHAAAPRSTGLFLLGLFAIVLAIAAFVLWSRREAPEIQAPVVQGSAGPLPQPAASAPVTLDIPEERALPSAGPAHSAPLPDKIFNAQTGALKDGIEALRQNAPDPSPATINELPPPPLVEGGNHSMQDAAKDAAKIFTTTRPKDAPAEKPDAAAPEPEAALGGDDALAALLAAERQRTAQLAAEIARLKAEREAGAQAALALAMSEAGAPSANALRATFPAARNAALAAIRRRDAAGPVARAVASLAAFVNLRRAGPTEGLDADAVMSRAEAAVEAGDLARALGELAGLPDAGVNAMADWRANAERRVSADRDARAAQQTLIALYAASRAP